MDDRLLEEQLRSALRAEGESVRVTVTGPEIRRRLDRRTMRPTSAWRFDVAFAAAAVVIAVAVAGLLLARPAPLLTGATATPGINATGSSSSTPTPRPTRDIGLGDGESEGVITLHVTSHGIEIERPAICTWSSFEPQGVAHIDSDPDAFELLGEAVTVSVALRDIVASGPALSLVREGRRAAYVGRGTVLTESTIADNGTTGRLRFAGLVPAIGGIPAQWLTAPRAEMGVPLGGNPDATSLDGIAMWACAPPPPEHRPGPSRAPGGTLDPLPAVTMTRGLASERGTASCIDAITWDDGTETFEDCLFAVPPPEDLSQPIFAEPGDALTAIGADDWHIERWAFDAARYDDIDAGNGEPRGGWRTLGAGDNEEAGLRAPEPGLWLLRANVTVRSGLVRATATWYFVLQSGPPVAPPLEPGRARLARVGPAVGSPPDAAVAFESPGFARIRVTCTGGGWVLLSGAGMARTAAQRCDATAAPPLVVETAGRGRQELLVTYRGYVAHAFVVVESGDGSASPAAPMPLTIPTVVSEGCDAALLADVRLEVDADAPEPILAVRADGTRVPLMFPSGTTATYDPETRDLEILLRGTTRLLVGPGDRVSFGGGAGPEPEDIRFFACSVVE